MFTAGWSYFFLNRSSRTTSAPPDGLSGSPLSLSATSAGFGVSLVASLGVSGFFASAFSTAGVAGPIAAGALGIGQLALQPRGLGFLDRLLGGDFFRAASSVTVSNCSPNCTDGSKKPFTVSSGTCSFSEMPLNDSATSK